MTDAAGERLRLDLGDDGVATITLDHPPLNIYDLEMRDQLIEAVTAVRDAPDVRCLLLTAAGSDFSAGADLAEFGGAESIVQARRIRWDRDPWLPLVDLPVPTLCALHGLALGSGFEMALHCDIRIAAADAEMALPEVTLGMLPAAGGTQSLTRLIGPSAALPLVLTGRRIGAEEARRFGIVWEVVPAAELPARAAALGAQLASLAAGGRQLTRALRRCLRAAGDLPLAEGLDLERRQAALLRRAG